MYQPGVSAILRTRLSMERMDFHCGRIHRLYIYPYWCRSKLRHEKRKLHDPEDLPKSDMSTFVLNRRPSVFRLPGSVFFVFLFFWPTLHLVSHQPHKRLYVVIWQRGKLATKSLTFNKKGKKKRTEMRRKKERKKSLVIFTWNEKTTLSLFLLLYKLPL